MKTMHKILSKILKKTISTIDDLQFSEMIRLGAKHMRFLEMAERGGVDFKTALLLSESLRRINSDWGFLDVLTFPDFVDGVKRGVYTAENTDYSGFLIFQETTREEIKTQMSNFKSNLRILDLI